MKIVKKTENNAKKQIINNGKKKVKFASSPSHEAVPANSSSDESGDEIWVYGSASESADEFQRRLEALVQGQGDHVDGDEDHYSPSDVGEDGETLFVGGGEGSVARESDDIPELPTEESSGESDAGSESSIDESEGADVEDESSTDDSEDEITRRSERVRNPTQRLTYDVVGDPVSRPCR